jgi:hypothetical protein
VHHTANTATKEDEILLKQKLLSSERRVGKKRVRGAAGASISIWTGVNLRTSKRVEREKSSSAVLGEGCL